MDGFVGDIFLERPSAPPVTSAPYFGTAGLSGATVFNLKTKISSFQLGINLCPG